MDRAKTLFVVVCFAMAIWLIDYAYYRHQLNWGTKHNVTECTKCGHILRGVCDFNQCRKCSAGYKEQRHGWEAECKAVSLFHGPTTQHNYYWIPPKPKGGPKL